MWSFKIRSDIDIQKKLEFNFVFGRDLESYNDVFHAIECEILHKFKIFNEKFSFLIPQESKELLKKLSKSDRKRFNISKNIPRYLAKDILFKLLDEDIIAIEKSREIKFQYSKHNKIKKDLRKYQIQDKIHFKNNIDRFWFRFCEPNLQLLSLGEFKAVLDIIKMEFEQYCSLPFELACIELVSRQLNINRQLITSYWDKENEIDIYASFDGFTLVGEVKYRNKKVCKNLLNLLNLKCERLDLKPDIKILFSKSGFSNELLSLKNDKMLLFDLDDFKDFYE